MPASDRLDLKARIVAIEAELAPLHPDGHVVITSLANLRTGSTAGSVSEVNIATAARLIANDEARIATEA